MKISAKAGRQMLELEVRRRNGDLVVEVNGVRHEVNARKLEDDFYSIVTGGRSYEVSVERSGDGYRVRHGAAEQLVTFSDPGRRARETLSVSGGPERVVALMPGKVVRVLVAEGDTVEAGQGVIVVEAMKMENEITATRAGTVTSVAVEPGQAVEGGALLTVIEAGDGC